MTDRDKPVIKIVPIQQEQTVAEMFSDLQGRVTYLEDIDQPSLPEWEDA